MPSLITIELYFEKRKKELSKIDDEFGRREYGSALAKYQKIEEEIKKQCSPYDNTQEYISLCKKIVTCARSLRKFDLASNYYDKLINFSPNDLGILTEYAVLCCQMKKYQNAYKTIETILDKHKKIDSSKLNSILVVLEILIFQAFNMCNFDRLAEYAKTVFAMGMAAEKSDCLAYARYYMAIYYQNKINEENKKSSIIVIEYYYSSSMKHWEEKIKSIASIGFDQTSHMGCCSKEAKDWADRIIKETSNNSDIQYKLESGNDFFSEDIGNFRACKLIKSLGDYVKNAICCYKRLADLYGGSQEIEKSEKSLHYYLKAIRFGDSYSLLGAARQCKVLAKKSEQIKLLEWAVKADFYEAAIELAKIKLFEVDTNYEYIKSLIENIKSSPVFGITANYLYACVLICEHLSISFAQLIDPTYQLPEIDKELFTKTVKFIKKENDPDARCILSRLRFPTESKLPGEQNESELNEAPDTNQSDSDSEAITGNLSPLLTESSNQNTDIPPIGKKRESASPYNERSDWGRVDKKIGGNKNSNSKSPTTFIKFVKKISYPDQNVYLPKTILQIGKLLSKEDNGIKLFDEHRNSIESILTKANQNISQYQSRDLCNLMTGAAALFAHGYSEVASMLLVNVCKKLTPICENMDRINFSSVLSAATRVDLKSHPIRNDIPTFIKFAQKKLPEWIESKEDIGNLLYSLAVLHAYQESINRKIDRGSKPVYEKLERIDWGIKMEKLKSAIAYALQELDNCKLEEKQRHQYFMAVMYFCDQSHGLLTPTEKKLLEDAEGKFKSISHQVHSSNLQKKTLEKLKTLVNGEFEEEVSYRTLPQDIVIRNVNNTRKTAVIGIQGPNHYCFADSGRFVSSPVELFHKKLIRRSANGQLFFSLNYAKIESKKDYIQDKLKRVLLSSN